MFFNYLSKKISVRNLFIILFSAIILSSCQTTTDKINDFVSNYNASSSMPNSYMIKSTRATASGGNEITIKINTFNDSINKEETRLIKSSIPEIMGQAIRSEKEGRELIEKDVKFIIKIYGLGGKVIADEVIDKNSAIGKSPKNIKSLLKENKKDSPLNTVLEIYNKSLPMEDKSSGTKIMSIKADDENNIVYTVEVPESYKVLLSIDDSEKIIKDKIAQSPRFKQIFTRTEDLGVSNIIFKYMDAKGNSVKEITINKDDIK